MTKIRTVLFDLDGTLADTAPDLAHALNLLLVEEGKTALLYETIRPEVSHGASALVTLGFGKKPGDADFDRLRQRFLVLYTENLCRHTRLFDGIPALLQTLKKQGMNWGVVTNKPAFLTDPLMAQLRPDPAPACVVSGDTVANRKPHPEPMLHACTAAGSRPEQCLYVGDAERDILAGRHAGMKTLVALFGYINGHETPERWGADGMIRAPGEILDWLKQDE
ncbi:phosphoglycolate phosphatase [Sulfuricaulis limicola]|uniref:Phosphoglycolate phosphatase n=1 Tax=Sulfuricaulis limicola TaxID=1620215 RepID=A0A1B4XFB1_9GAMM|nr:HAD-IA family hydrolase [Sulfuricaulis limicola]BAV33482.1 phosphoglycolate phosphatase [Sulfuricaulis limicola]